MILASKAYGETVLAYADYKRKFVSDEPVKRVARVQRHGMDWDDLAQEMCQKLIREVDRLREEHLELAVVVLPRGVGDGVAAIAQGPPEWSGQVGSVAHWKTRL